MVFSEQMLLPATSTKHSDLSVLFVVTILIDPIDMVVPGALIRSLPAVYCADAVSLRPFTAACYESIIDLSLPLRFTMIRPEHHFPVLFLAGPLYRLAARIYELR